MSPDNPLPEIPTLILSPTPNRRAEFWSAEKEVMVYQYDIANIPVSCAIESLAHAWLSSAPGNCVNFCS